MAELGPRSRRIYDDLARRIRSGALAPGAQLPSHRQLATEFGVAPMTVRQVLGMLESAGLITRQTGRGTFVRQPGRLGLLVVARTAEQHALVGKAANAGYTPNSVATSHEALACLSADATIGLVMADLSDLEMVRALQRRWPSLTFIALVCSASELAPLQGSPEWPLLTLPLPSTVEQLERVLHLGFSSARQPVDATREVLEFQAQLLAAVDQAIVATGSGGNIIYWNSGAERLYGWNAAEVLGRNVGEVLVAPYARERAEDIMTQLRRGQRWRGEFPVQRRDGSAIPLLVTDSPIVDAAGRLVGIIGVAVEISD